MEISKRELEELRPDLDRSVRKVLGSEDGKAVSIVTSCISKGYSRDKTIRKLSDYIGSERKAEKLADYVFDQLSAAENGSERSHRHHHHHSSRKRKSEKDDYNHVGDGNVGDVLPAAKKKAKDGAGDAATEATPAVLDPKQIQEMMVHAQKMIEERKKQIQHIVPAGPKRPSMLPPSDVAAAVAADSERLRKATELQASIQSRLTALSAQGTPGLNVAAGPKPTPLILDSLGRTVDQEGKAVQLTQRMPTLKANIRAVRREQFQKVQDKPVEELADTSSYFDPRVGSKTVVRSRRKFQFHEQGKFEALAQRVRAKDQLEKLQNEIAQAAKKTGINSATKLALIKPKQVAVGDVPEVEWWDTVILRTDSYPASQQQPENKMAAPMVEGITRLVEHPVQMMSRDTEEKEVALQMFLTKKEQKKLRRQNRTEALKEKQEKVRLGLEAPAEAKVKMSNLMRVLGSEAVQDPTKVEAHVRAQMAKRQKQHLAANKARKLTTDQKKDKKLKKIKEDTSDGVHVTVYRVRDLMNPAKKFKVETNAAQLFLTGLVVLHKDCNVVVVEGGPNQQKKFKRLMMHRIKWSEDVAGEKKDGVKRSGAEGIYGSQPGGAPLQNQCDLVWEGMALRRHFGRVVFKLCPTENIAREHFRQHGVEQYWDLAYSDKILQASEEG